MRPFLTFPDDPNGDVLRRMQEDGDDLTRTRDVEFFFVFSAEHEARSFAAQALPTDCRVTVEPYSGAQPWQAVIVKHMLPTYAEIGALESALAELAAVYSGEPDGWGCLQVG